MENFDEFIKQRILSLPLEIQKAFKETDIVGEIEKIRVKFKLMFDQGSVLETETKLVFLGLENPNDLLKNISNNANVSKEIASQIVNEIESNIFKQIKSKLIDTLKKEDEESQKKVALEETKKEEKLDRDSILNEIENPTPTFTKAKTEEIKPISHIPEIAPDMTLAKTPIVEAPKYKMPTQTKSIIEQKLSEPTHTTPKETEIFLKKIPHKNPSDPYKEPID